MRKMYLKGIGAVLTVVVAAVVTFSLNFNKNADGLSELALKNVEALAYGELTPSGSICVAGYEDGYGHDLSVAVRECAHCSMVLVSSAWNASYCHGSSD